MPFTRAMGRAWMPRLVSFGWSSNRIIGWLTARDAQYWRNTMLADIRQIRLRQEFTPKIMDLAGDATIKQSIIADTQLRQKRKYRVFAEAKKFDTETGRTYYERISFYDDTLKTKDAWSDDYMDAMFESEQYPNVEIQKLQITMVEHNKGYPY